MPQGSARLEPLLRDVSVLGRCHRAHKETVALTSSGVGRGGFTIARWGPNSYDILAGGDWNHGILWLSIYYWECHHPNWRTLWFFRGIETTNQYRYIECSKTSNDLVAHGGPWWPNGDVNKKVEHGLARIHGVQHPWCKMFFLAHLRSLCPGICMSSRRTPSRHVEYGHGESLALPLNLTNTRELDH